MEAYQRADGEAQERRTQSPIAVFRTGPFTVRIETPFVRLRERLNWCYGQDETPASDSLIDFQLRVDRGAWLPRLFSPQAVFWFENSRPFQPFPRDHAFPLTEWGLNWCIANRAHQFLMLHSAVLERQGSALILPATPGSGKSTLGAAMAYSGWRLLSDEFGLIDYRNGWMHPLPRAVPLKNTSIDVIRAFAPTASIGPTFPRTRKGDVAHMRPPLDSLRRQQETAWPSHVVFPRFVSGSDLRIRKLQKSLAFTRLAQNSFNYRLLGAQGFEQLSRLVQRCDCYSAQFGHLEDIVPALEQLTGLSRE